MIITFKMFENKQVGELYHLVDIDKLNFIIDTNTIKSYKFNNISLTRNILLNSYIGNNPTTIFKLIIDADKLSNSYKIKPFRYKSMNGMFFNEYEEVVLTNNIIDAFKYIKKVVLIKSKVEMLKTNLYDEVSDWFTNIGGYNGNLPDLINKIQTKLKTLYNKDIYIQDKNKIIKDDKYLNSIINYKLKIIKIKKFIAYRGYVKSEKYFGSDDYLVDKNGNILTKHLVIGKTIKLTDHLEYISNNIINIRNKFYNKKMFKQYKDYNNRYVWFNPYIIYVRLLDNGKWKIDDIYPLKTKEKI